jgi:hypothetical protein
MMNNKPMTVMAAIGLFIVISFANLRRPAILI